MSAVTDTTKHEKDDDLPAVTRLIAEDRGWIPAFAGMTMVVALVLKGGFETRPYEYRLAG